MFDVTLQSIDLETVRTIRQASEVVIVQIGRAHV